MLVESQNKLCNDQKSTKTFEVAKYRKYCKWRSIENEPIKCQKMHDTSIEMEMIKRQKTHPTATRAHQKKHLTIHQNKFNQ